MTKGKPGCWAGLPSLFVVATSFPSLKVEGRQWKDATAAMVISLEADPNAWGGPAVVAASLSWIAPPVLSAISISPFPIVLIDLDFGLRGVRMFFFNAPAVPVFIANDGSRRTRTQSDDAEDTQNGASQILHVFLLIGSRVLQTPRYLLCFIRGLTTAPSWCFAQTQSARPVSGDGHKQSARGVLPPGGVPGWSQLQQGPIPMARVSAQYAGGFWD